MCCAADVIDHAKRVGRQAIAAQAHAAAIESGGSWLFGGWSLGTCSRDPGPLDPGPLDVENLQRHAPVARRVLQRGYAAPNGDGRIGSSQRQAYFRGRALRTTSAAGAT